MLGGLQVWGGKWITRWQWETQKNLKSSLVPAKLPGLGREHGQADGQLMGPILGRIPLPTLSCTGQQSWHCSITVLSRMVVSPTAQGKLVTVSARAVGRHQGKLRHRGLHTCHATPQ